MKREGKKGEFTYYTWDEIKKEMTEEELEKFCQWITGQTCGIVNGKVVYYSWDVERFLDMVRKGKKTYFD